MNHRSSVETTRRHRNQEGDVGLDKLIGSLLTGWAVPGIEMARARFRLLCGTAGTSSVDAKGEGQVHKHKAQSTEAMHEGRIDP